MTEQASKLPRKPFGYDPTVVDQMLSDRDAMLSLAERRVRDAEAKAAHLEGQLQEHQRAVAQLSEQLAVAQAAPSSPAPAVESETEPASTDEEPLTPQFVTDEISKVIAAAEASTSQILERAWVATRDQVLEADRLWREVQSEVVRFAAWRDEAEAVSRGVQDAMEEARRRIESVPQRIQEALAPVVESMVSVDAGVGRFTAATTIPLLLTPSGLEAARARAEAMGHGAEMGGASASGPFDAGGGNGWSQPEASEAEWSGMPEPAGTDAEWSGMPRSEGTDAEWSGIPQIDVPEWAATPSEPASEHGADHAADPAAGGDAESDTAVDEASKQLREFLGISGQQADRDYEAGQPWGA